MREENQIQQVLKIIEGYDHQQPLSRYLSEYYKEHKQMGSRDRKQASQLVYGYFRLGKALPNKSKEERLAVGTYLSSGLNLPASDYLWSKWKLPSHDNYNAGERVKNILEKYSEFQLKDIFPFSKHLSEEIDFLSFVSSFLQQPRLFIRIRKAYKNQVVQDLKKNEVAFEQEENPLTLSFANATSLNNLETFKKGYFEIQDKSSQQTSAFFKAQPGEYWWDACAASGGKSLSLIDQEPSVKLFVSDIRLSVLNNLNERFNRIHFKNYHSKVIDLSSELDLKEGPFDGIIVDAPCSGSGTWARTPEMISTFDEKELQNFQALQQKICSQVVHYLKPGQPLIYSTCSVFREENENVVDFLVKNHPLKLEEMTVIKGYENKADSMFVARLHRLK